MRCRSVIAGLALAAAPVPAIEHGFAQRYDLPVPLGLYLIGAGTAVALSFAVIALFVRGDCIVLNYPRVNLLVAPWTGPLFRVLASRVFVETLRALAVAMLTLVIVGGYVGPDNPFQNIAPTAIWVVWWVGLAYLSGLLGDLWALLNPWSAVFRWAERAWIGLAPSRRFGLGLGWPRWLGCWPAVGLFIAFVWCELIWLQSDQPDSLATAALAYTLLTLLGMFIFGRHAWLRGGETFTLLFGFLARFAPTEWRVTDGRLCAACSSGDCHDPYAGCANCLECFEHAPAAARELNLRPWAVGLLTARPLAASAVAFVLVMLSSVTFDGLLATPLWAALGHDMLYSEGLRPVLLVLQDFAGDAIAAVGTIALVVFLLAFQALFLLFCILMRRCIPGIPRRSLPLLAIPGLFVLSLVPIALAYHLAHYLTYLAIAGQYLIPVLSDPFGLGWDMFGTRLYRVDISIVNARLVWFTSVIAIVVGHIIAVWLAHVTALRTLRDNRAALLSQVPMLLLMVAYTVLSLWILAQPIVE